MEDTVDNTHIREEIAHLQGKYLTILLDGRQYGVCITKVEEILIGYMAITRVPLSPPFLKGVVNLRGRIIPVVNLRSKIGLQEKGADKETCILVVKVSIDDRPFVMGMIVDTVLEVIDFDHSMLALASSHGMQLNTEYITGMGALPDGNSVILIDLNEIFRSLGATLTQ